MQNAATNWRMPVCFGDFGLKLGKVDINFHGWGCLFFWIEQLLILLFFKGRWKWGKSSPAEWMLLWDPSLVSREWKHHYQGAFLMSPCALGWKWAESFMAVPVYTRVQQRVLCYKRKVKSPAEVVSAEWCWGSGSSPASCGDIGWICSLLGT